MDSPTTAATHSPHTSSQECGLGEGGGVYVTLLQSDTVHAYGHVKGEECGMRRVGVQIKC